jgi:hypothetical protein
MSVTLLYEDAEPVAAHDATRAGDDLFVSPPEFASATGWTLKPQGLCKGDACLVLPADGSWRDDAGRISVTAFAEHFKRPVVRDEEHAVWAIGPSADDRLATLLSLEAPDFTLPDLDGNLHSLSDFRGKKVFLMSWGSY